MLVSDKCPDQTGEEHDCPMYYSSSDAFNQNKNKDSPKIIVSFRKWGKFQLTLHLLTFLEGESEVWFSIAVT